MRTSLRATAPMQSSHPEPALLHVTCCPVVLPGGCLSRAYIVVRLNRLCYMLILDTLPRNIITTLIHLLRHSCMRARRECILPSLPRYAAAPRRRAIAMPCQYSACSAVASAGATLATRTAALLRWRRRQERGDLDACPPR
eukprot:3773082-Pleurochrysis_carterae.AAC.5